MESKPDALIQWEKEIQAAKDRCNVTGACNFAEYDRDCRAATVRYIDAVRRSRDAREAS